MAVRVVLALGLAAALGCDSVFFECPPTEAATGGELPELLSASGLYRDIAAETFADGVRPYRPQFPFWSDGAAKRRWIRLPAGAVIDTSDMDSWQLPVGTRVWKEFSRDGVRVETRVIERREDGRWAALAYLWDSDGSDARAVPLGAIDARGTEHDVPAAGECVGCHGGRGSYALGFSAIQLAHSADPGELALGELLERDLLSHPPQRSLEVPGDATTRRALGYLHANCGHCHNQDRPGAAEAPCYDPQNRLDFWLRADALERPEDTATYRSALGDRIVPGRPDDSLVVERMSQRTFIYGMPPLGSELVDRDGTEAIRAWIREL